MKPTKQVIKIAWLDLVVAQYPSTGKRWFWYCNLPSLTSPMPLVAKTADGARDEALQEFMGQLSLLLNNKDLQEADRRRRSGKNRLRRTGTACSACGHPQFQTPSGVSCKMGHGGAEPRVAR